MKSVPLNLRNGTIDLREAARAAARRTGMTLGAWLDDAIAERAARLRVDPEDLDESEQIDAIAARLGALPLDDAPARRSPPPLPRHMDLAAPVRGRKPNMRLLDAAVARLGLDIDLTQSAQAEPDDVVEVARRIAELEEALGRRAAGRAPEVVRPQIESRLRRIAESLLEAETEPKSPELRRIEARLDRLIDAMEHPARAHKNRPDPLQGELEALRARIEDLSRAVNAIGERAKKQNLEPALLDLLSRIDASRADGVSDETLAPVTGMLIEIRDALEHAPAATARALGAEIDALHRRLDRAAQTSDEAAIHGLRRQVEALARGLADLVTRLSSHEALQGQIALLAQRVEDIAAAPRELSQRLVGLVEDLRDCVERLDANPAFRALEQRLDDIAGQAGQASPAVTRTLAEMRDAIDNLTEHPTMRAMQMQMAQLAQMTGEFPRRLADTLEDLRRAIENMAANPVLGAEMRAAPLPGHVVESLAEIRLSLERLAANAGVRLAEDQAQRLQNIEDRVTEISEKLDAPPIIERIAGLQESLLARMDHLRSELPNEQIAALRARVEDVHRAVSQPTLPQAPADLENIVGQLATKLDRAAETGAQDPRALQAIENQVLRIAERLDRHGETSEAIGTLERSISDLFVQVSETRQAAETTIGETIARDLSSLREVQDETERRTRATLEAVHETLEKVVDRLAMLEGDVGVLRVKPAAEGEQEPELAASLAPVVETITTEATASPVDLDSLAQAIADMPQAPEQTAPIIVVEPPQPQAQETRQESQQESQQAQAVQPPSRHDLALELSEPRAAQKSFIAAARRATQLMGGAPPPPRIEHDPELAEARSRAKAAADAVDASEKSGFSDHSRKIMLGVAGVVLSLGAYQLIRDESPMAGAAPSVAAAPEGATAPAQQAAGEPLDPTPVGSIARPTGAFEILLELANSGNAPAQFELASRLVEGRGVTRDTVQAVRWLEKSADQTYAPAQYRLGALYEKGAGVERSMKTAMHWYGRAAEAGHVRAMHNLGVLLADGADGRADYAGAAGMFRRAAEQGLRDSQYNLAVLHVRGLGVEANLVEAYKFFSLAGAQGDKDALTRRDEVATRMQARQLNEARRAVEAFALRTPDPAVNEAPAFDDIVGAAHASRPVDLSPTPFRNKVDARLTSMK